MLAPHRSSRLAKAEARSAVSVLMKSSSGRNAGSPFGCSSLSPADQGIRKLLETGQWSLRMGEFFIGWRRKTGCVTLVVALAITATWLRSHEYSDSYTFGYGPGKLSQGTARPTLYSRPDSLELVIEYVPSMEWVTGWDIG